MVQRGSGWLVVLLLLSLTIPAAAQGGSGGGAVLGPEEYPEGVNPLTGLALDMPENLERRPLLVKITNWPPVVRPQSGLSQADHVWEILVEGGVTRFAAVFLGQDVEHLGPVRSARLSDLPLVHYYAAIYGYSGAAQGTLDRIRADRFVANSAVGGGPCPPYCRFPQPGLAYEHTLYTTTEDLHRAAAAEGIIDERVDLSGLAFNVQVPAGGVMTPSFDLFYRQTAVNWAYEAASGRWLRSQDGEPQFDALTGERISAANVVVFEAVHTEQERVRDNYWGTANYAFDITLSGEGRAVLFRDGRYFEGRWVRPTEEDRIHFQDEAGDLLPFKPGNTWFQLVPATWFNGYQLIIAREDAPVASVTAASLNLRAGPGTGFGLLGVGVRGTELHLLGRDETGAWVVGRLEDGRTVWAAVDFLNLNGLAVMDLPLAVHN